VRRKGGKEKEAGEKRAFPDSTERVLGKRLDQMEEGKGKVDRQGRRKIKGEET